MPVIVNDFIWTQTEEEIHIKASLKGIPHSQVDIFATDVYLKTHYKPFILETYLLHEVDIKNSVCTINEGMIEYRLVKRSPSTWPHLEKVLSNKEKVEFKKNVLEKCSEQAKEAFEANRTKKTEVDRHAVQKAMDVDSKQHEIIDLRRNEERRKAMEQLEDWRVVQESQEVKKTASKDRLKSKSEKNIEINVRHQEKPASRIVRSEYIEKKKSEMQRRVLPALRHAGQVDVQFTPRSFPTPSRESNAKEEQEWLKNMMAARRAVGFVSEDLRPEEQDPEWCKAKGDDFFRKGNFLGAISAYSHAIKLAEKLPTVYANRSAAHFALGNFHKCLEDCSTAIELMVPACEGNRLSRGKCITRRAAALTRLGMLGKAIEEMKAASRLMPDDAKIKEDINNMERAWEQNPDSD